MNKKPTLRAKNMMYVQQLGHLPAKINTVDKLAEMIEKRLAPQRYALIVHDKDINDKGQPEGDHVHAMLSFGNARSINSIAKCLGDKPQQIQVYGKHAKKDEEKDAKNGFAYLIHATDGARMKHQYDINEVKANFDYPALIGKISKEVKTADGFSSSSQIRVLLNLLYNGEISKEEAEGRLTGAQYARAHRQIEDVWMKRQQDSAAQWRKEMSESGRPIKVIWIFGQAGTGKTSLAKEYARKTGQPFYMAGSSRDIFQTYKGEHTLLLDELRPRTIEYHDLLRILDPFGMDEQVMSPSRYTDKPLVCDLIIITCPYDPLSFYHELFGWRDNHIDSFKQLERRISLMVCMKETEISTVKYDSAHNALVTDPASIRPNPYSSANRPAMAAIDSNELYNSMFG